MKDKPRVDTPGAGGGLRAFEARISSVIRGKPEAIRLAVCALIGKGHLLIEDVPGVGKTTLAFALAKAVNCTFQRIQFTSDLLPTDITGVNIYNPETREFEFKRGPIFANIVLADEINRTSPRTQSALLESMNERRLTVDGITHLLPEPFMVIATQNSLEYRGTFPLPESQLDRFMLHMRLGYPSPEHERQVLLNQITFNDIDAMQPVVSAGEVMGMQAQAEAVRVDESVLDYIMELIAETRRDEAVRLGASTRGAQYLLAASKANAFYDGRDFLVPNDVKFMAPHVLGHRLMLGRQTYISDAVRLVRKILQRVPVPV